MLGRCFFACVFLTLHGACASLSCRWMDNKFRQYSENSLILLNMMVNPSMSEDAETTVAFPHHLYNQASKAPFEGKLVFTAQVLQEVSGLFEEEDRPSSWGEITVEHFLSVVHKQAEELQLCAGRFRKTNRRLHMYFKRLSRSIFQQSGSSAEAWELIRRQIKAHLMRTDNLISPLLAYY